MDNYEERIKHYIYIYIYDIYIYDIYIYITSVATTNAVINNGTIDATNTINSPINAISTFNVFIY